jgi:hypothetical protein
MEQYGFADGDQVNVVGNVYQIRTTSFPEFENSNQTGDVSFGAVFYGFVIFVAIGAMILFGMHSGIFATSAPVNFPDTNSPWPKHSNADLVMAPVGEWLASCAEEPLLSPEYCPQSVSSSADNVSNVQWVIHGSPTYGARIAYHNGRFYILGHAVMTVTYDSDSGSQWQMQIFGYEAVVTWDGGHATLASSSAVSLTGGPSVMKHNPNLPWSEVSNVVETGFRQCAASHVAPLPPQCPDIGNGGSGVRWQLMNNPLLNARESFDVSTGLVHVTGSFVLSESYSELLFGHQTYTWSGYYNASISLDGTSITLLELEKQ